jgi:hypothetical protein
MMLKEKGRREGDPIPYVVRQDNSEYATSKLHLQVFRLTRRCAISAAMAAIMAPLIFGEVSP